MLFSMAPYTACSFNDSSAHADLYTSESDVYRRLILTYKDGPRAERVEPPVQIIFHFFLIFFISRPTFNTSKNRRIANILILRRGDRLFTSESDVYRRQILTYKDGTRTEKITTFIMAVSP